MIALLGIIAAIAIPRLTGFKSMAEERACNANRITVERMYSAFLLQKVHNDSIFNQFYIENFDEVLKLLQWDEIHDPQGDNTKYETFDYSTL